ncbi:transketolase [Candidatus Woesearchaeota archaeon]|nr:transketolase [Candidatus Woesearchaeota archaeon]
MKKEEIITEKVNKYAELIVRSTTEAATGHPSSALSLVHIIATLITTKNFNPLNPFDRKTNDVIILSEGHAVPVLYSAWAVQGMHYLENSSIKKLSPENLEALRDLNSVLDGHPSPYTELPDGKIARLPFPCATGALGQGLSIANGIALADCFDKIKRNIFVICGDSEFREGQIDEALRFANTYKLPITLFLNINEWGQSAKTKDLVKYNYKKELEAKHWKIYEINGHKILDILKILKKQIKKPTAILAHTVKGWGVKKLQEGNWHGKTLLKEDAQKALLEIFEQQKKQFQEHNNLASTKILLEPTKLKANLFLPKFTDWDSAYKETKKISARKAYGYALRELGKDKNIVVCDAEVSNSTMTEFFRKKYPDRFVECAIAEQNMMGVGAGLASQGKIVFVNTFARFLETCFTQWNIALQSRLPIHVVGSHTGLSPHSDGPSQMGLADLSYALSMPGLVVVSPSDAVSSYWLTEECAKHNGPTYQRNYRPDMPLLYKLKEKFKIGGSKILRKGEHGLIISHGYTIHIALEAAQELEKQGLPVSVIDAYSLKPIDSQGIISEADKSKKVVTLEDNYFGGLACEIAVIAANKNWKLKQLYIKRWPKSSRKISEMLEYCSVSAKDVVKAIKELHME